MKYILNTLFVILVILLSRSPTAATYLSDIELDGISGGAINTHIDGQSLPQEQQQPGTNNSNYLPLMTLKKNDGMELAPEFFSILQSTVDVKRDRRVYLDGMTQKGAKALNLDNVLSSDNIATNNIFNGGSLTINDVTTEIQINQQNSINQLHRTQGNLNSSVAGHRYETTTHLKNNSENFDRRIYISIDQQDQTSTLTRDINDWGVVVGKINFAEQFTEGQRIITLLEPETITLIAAGSVGDIVDGLWDTKWGVKASYSGLFLEGPSASVNEIRQYGPGNNDLLVDSTIRLGYIDFGVFSAQGCVGGCAPEIKLDLGELEILNLFEFLEKINPVIDGIAFSKEGIILEGMGSVFDDELNLNTGFAFVGNGNLVISPPSLKVAGQLNLSIDADLTFTLDLASVDLGLLGTWPKTWSWPDNAENENIIDLEIPFTLLDITGDSYNDSFDAELVAKLGPGDVSANIDISNIPPETDENSSLIFDTDFIDIGESSSSEIYKHTVLTGGQMTGAEAELLALSEGTLSVNNNNNVLLKGSAQQNMRIIHSVNAVTSVAANAMNISRLPVITRGSSAVQRVSMQQHNRFVQQR